ncbi:MAG: uroporphyrinogen decarboxylase family protein [Dysgonamonadaceae bacterium]|jgi:uroporphyrinogen decarboxylase|nr:uroporphyrinogen decarboxylase family protein [Dysgonamonadaceae bacterium]
MNVSNWVNDVINNPMRLAIPVMTHPGIEMTGKTILEAVTDGNVHFAAIKAINERFPSAASTVIMDLTVEAEAFGAEIHFSEHEVPSVIGRLVSDFDSVEQLKVPELSAGRIPQYILANRLAAENINDKPVWSGCIGPFSLAGRLYDMTEIMVGMYIDTDAVRLLLEKCTEFIIKYGKELKKTGVDGIVIAEPAAGLLSNEDCQEFSSVYVKQIIEALQDDSFAVILHNCGNHGHCTPAMLHTGALGYHFGDAMDMQEALESCPDNVLVMGNISPVGLFKMGTPETMREAVLDLLHQTKNHKNFVLSSGCDTPPQAPFANIEAFYAALKEFNSNQ